MKREILCATCAKQYKQQYRFNANGIAQPYPDEFVRLVVGILKERPGPEGIRIYTGSDALTRSGPPTREIPFASDQYICDLCSMVIEVGNIAGCLSIWMEGRGGYVAWEGDYLEVESDG